MAFTINNTQEQPLSLQAFDGNGAAISSSGYARTWTSDNPSVMVTGVASDGIQVAAAVPGAVGSANLTAHVTRTDGSIANSSPVQVNVVAPPPLLPATVAISAFGAPRTRTLP